MAIVRRPHPGQLAIPWSRRDGRVACGRAPGFPAVSARAGRRQAHPWGRKWPHAMLRSTRPTFGSRRSSDGERNGGQGPPPDQPARTGFAAHGGRRVRNLRGAGAARPDAFEARRRPCRRRPHGGSPIARGALAMTTMEAAAARSRQARTTSGAGGGIAAAAPGFAGTLERRPGGHSSAIVCACSRVAWNCTSGARSCASCRLTRVGAR